MAQEQVQPDAAQGAAPADAQELMAKIQQAAEMVDAGLSVLIEGMKAVEPAVADKLMNVQMTFKESLGGGSGWDSLSKF